MGQFSGAVGAVRPRVLDRRSAGRLMPAVGRQLFDSLPENNAALDVLNVRPCAGVCSCSIALSQIFSRP
jgi:hypothetical protein